MFDTIFEPSFHLTLKVSLLSMLLQLLVGIPLGLYISGKRNVFKHVLDIAISLPMVFPPMALGFFLLLIFGKRGFLGKTLLTLFDTKIIFSFWGVFIAVFVVGLPFMVKSVQSARKQLPTSIVEAALTLGKSKFTIVYRVILPNIKQGILTGLLLAFGRSLGEVGISLMLGGNIIGRTETLSLAIYNAVFDGNYELATRLSIFLSIIATLVLVIINISSSQFKCPKILKERKLFKRSMINRKKLFELMNYRLAVRFNKE